MIDLRSDTVTRPTPAMRAAMAAAPVGDDVYGDDPTVLELEALAAQAVGMEAALFVCSGTMGNQLAIMTHTRPGDEIIAGLHSHVIQHEAGGYARLSGVSAMLADTGAGPITGEQVRALARDSHDIHHPKSALLCLENALGDGTVATAEQTAQAAGAALALGMQAHLDGARIFNAATALGTTARELAAGVDSVMFCLSKGLCAPVGSMLCGTRDFVARARRNRKLLGGGLRQAGVLAACGLIAIREMTKRLGEDHANARALVQALAALPGVSVDVGRAQINMVFGRFASAKRGDGQSPAWDDGAFTAWLKARGVLINGAADGYYRFVTHNDVGAADVQAFAGLVGEYLRGR